MSAPLPVTFEIPASHRVRRAVTGWVSAALGLAWVALGAVALAEGIGPDPLSLLPPLGLLLLTLGAAMVLPRLRPARTATLRVEAARLVTEDPRGTRKFPAHKATATLTREGPELVLYLDDAERRRPTRPVRVVLARHDAADHAHIAALARVLAGSTDPETRRTVSALTEGAAAVTLAG